ncbi:MAG: hypothetical protein ABFC71_09045 [Methanoregula sp.]
MTQYHFGLIAVLLLVALAISPVACGSNDTWDQSYYLTHKETLAGPKDMSQYNPQVTPVPIRAMDKETARLYPNVSVCEKDGCLKTEPCPFSFLRCGRSLSVMVVYTANGTRPGLAGSVASVGIFGGLSPEQVYVYRAGTPGIFLQFDPYAWGAP